MGLLSFLFSTDYKFEIEQCEERIKNHRRNVQICMKNAERSKEAYLKKGHKEKARHFRKLIKMDQEKMKTLKEEWRRKKKKSKK